MSQEQENYFFILGLDLDSSPFEIEQAFKFLSLAYHPDHFPEKWRPLANERMLQVIEARASLKKHFEHRPTLVEAPAHNHSSTQTSQKSKEAKVEDNPKGKNWRKTFSPGIQLCNGSQCRELFIQPDEPCILSDQGIYFHPGCA